MSRKLFFVDIGRCTGCNACSIACKDRAGLPDDLDFLRVERVESGLYPDVKMYYRIMHCFHCEKPPCVGECPTGAISKKNDGFIHLDAKNCNNCGACRDVCPFDSIIELPEGFHSKCDGCHDEVINGWDPTCVRACPMRALYFKTVNYVDFAAYRIEKDFEDHGIEPSVMFLRKKRSNMNYV